MIGVCRLLCLNDSMIGVSDDGVIGVSVDCCVCDDGMIGVSVDCCV
jgi:hypothetical protein